jgi:hypothetical protein
MAVTHPITRDVYELEDDGLVKVTTPDGRTGLFSADGAHVSGEVRAADPHVLDWVGGPQAKSPMGRMSAAFGSES